MTPFTDGELWITWTALDKIVDEEVAYDSDFYEVAAAAQAKIEAMASDAVRAQIEIYRDPAMIEAGLLTTVAAHREGGQNTK